MLNLLLCWAVSPWNTQAEPSSGPAKAMAEGRWAVHRGIVSLDQRTWYGLNPALPLSNSVPSVSSRKRLIMPAQNQL